MFSLRRNKLRVLFFSLSCSRKNGWETLGQEITAEQLFLIYLFRKVHTSNPFFEKTSLSSRLSLSSSSSLSSRPRLFFDGFIVVEIEVTSEKKDETRPVNARFKQACRKFKGPLDECFNYLTARQKWFYLAVRATRSTLQFVRKI